MKQMLKKILAILIVAITIMTNISLGVSSQDSKDLQDKIDKTKKLLLCFSVIICGLLLT